MECESRCSSGPADPEESDSSDSSVNELIELIALKLSAAAPKVLQGEETKNESKEVEKLFDILKPQKNVRIRSKAQSAYIYDCEPAKGCETKGCDKQEEKSKEEDWRADGYRWRQSGGWKDFDFSLHQGQKMFFYTITQVEDGKSETSNKFRRLAYTHPSHPNQVLVVYLGNHDLANLKLPHGNAKKSQRPYFQTMKSLKAKMKTLPGPPAKVYHHLKNTAPRELVRHVSEAPRNLNQVQNFQKAEKKKRLLAHDPLYGLIMLSQHLPEFVKSIHVHPDLEVVCVHNENGKVLRKLLSKSEGKAKKKSVGLFVDTTFTLGDFYLTIASFNETEFEGNRIIPVFFLIHERKYSETHDIFWNLITDYFPELRTATNLYICTDEEAAILNAISAHLPKADLFLCWNHILAKSERYILNSEHIPVKEKESVHLYKQQLKELFSFDSRMLYDQNNTAYMRKWNKIFSDYFFDNIHPDVDQIGRWSLKKHQLISITNNPAESMNSKLKRVMEGKEVNIDQMVIILFRLSSSIFNEIMRGRYGFGEYQLLPEYSSLYCLERDNPVLPEVGSLSVEEVVNRVLSGKDIYDEYMAPDSETEDELESKPPGVRSNVIYEMAKNVIDNNLLHIDVPSRRFVVRGPGEPYLVRVLPKPKCQCGSTTTCHHLLAVEMFLGLNDKSAGKPGSSTLLRRRNRAQADRRGGRKKPRVNDVKNPEKKSDEAKLADPSSMLKGPIDFEKDVTQQTPSIDHQSGNAKECATPDSDKENESPISHSTSIKPLLTQNFSNDKKLMSSHVEEIEKNESDKENDIPDIKNSSIQSLPIPESSEQIKTTFFKLELPCPPSAIKITNKEWLSTEHVNGWNIMLRRLCGTQVGGLYNVDGNPDVDFEDEPNKCWIQAIHNGEKKGGHWSVAACGLKCIPNGSVGFFDSLGSSSISNVALRRIASLVRCPQKSFELYFMPCSKQKNSFDCGPYALAFATALARGLDPSQIEFDPDTIRDSVRVGLSSLHEAPLFKSTAIQRAKQEIKKTVPVYCLCRLPERLTNGNKKIFEKMAECCTCGEWFHKRCLPQAYLIVFGKPENFFWECPLCNPVPS